MLGDFGLTDILGEVCEGNAEPCSITANTLVAVADNTGFFRINISKNGTLTLNAFDFIGVECF